MMRKTVEGPNWIEFRHCEVEGKATEGDTDACFTAQDETFNVSLSCYMGRDRSNYDFSHDVEVDLSENEARQLHLLLHMWLEQQ